MNRYKNIPVVKIDNKLNYQTTRYTEVPLNDNDTYVYSTQGDRFDVLANQYYGDQSLWWIISIANTATAGTSLPSDLPQDSLIIPEGLQIRIPANYVDVINDFKKLNEGKVIYQNEEQEYVFSHFSQFKFNLKTEKFIHSYMHQP